MSCERLPCEKEACKQTKEDFRQAFVQLGIERAKAARLKAELDELKAKVKHVVGVAVEAALKEFLALKL